MRLSRLRWSALVAVIATVPAFAGCSVIDPLPPSHTPSASPSAAPISDEAALARATSAYAAYLAMIDTILSEGGRDPERIRQVATGKAADDFIRDAGEFTSLGLHTVGRTSFDSVRLESNGANTVRFYVCIDESAIDLTDQSGASAPRGDRDNRTPYVAGARLPDAIIEQDQVWTGPQFC